MRTAEGRHAAQLHPVFNDVVDFAIRQALRCGSAQVWDARILMQSDLCRAAAADAMTDSAPREKLLASLFQRFGVASEGVLFAAFPHGNGQVPQATGYDGLERRRRGSGAKAPQHQERQAKDSEGQEPQDRNQNRLP